MKSEQKNTGLEDILRSKYKKFNKCYEAAYKGRNYEERDEYRLVIESVKKLTENEETNKPETNALIAYMLLKTSRLRAIINNSARVPDLKNQNRMLWNKSMIEDGLEFLNKSADGSTVTEYHLRAGICACHSLAKDYESTDWKQIISLYDQYLEINHSIEIAIERAQLVSEIEGPRAAVNTLVGLDPKDSSTRSKVVSAHLGELYIKLNEYDHAIDHLSKSRELSDCTKERTSYLNRIEFCKKRLQLSKKYEQVLSF